MNLDTLQTAKNQAFIFECLNHLQANGLCTDRLLAVLTDTGQCKQLFSSRGAVLCEVTQMSQSEIEQLRYDGSSKPRYYAELFRVSGRSFLVTNYWYNAVSEQRSAVKDNRTPFLQWVEAQK